MYSNPKWKYIQNVCFQIAFTSLTAIKYKKSLEAYYHLNYIVSLHIYTTTIF